MVADDSTLIREGLVHVLERAGFEVLAAVGDAQELLSRVAALNPDVVITDIQMPPDHAEDGLRAAVELRRTRPEIGVILLSQHLEDEYAFDLVGERPEGAGYLLKEKIANPNLLADAVRRVAEGGAALDPDVISRLVGRKRAAGPLDELTPRERDVLALMAEGRSNTGIAQILVVTVAAVERHVTNIFAKLNLHQSSSSQHRRVLAVLTYLQG